MTTKFPIFLCGMPRSATTWLSRRLGEHSEVAVFGESDYWARSFVEPGPFGRYDEAALRRVAHIQSTKEWATTTGDDTGSLPDLPPGRYGQLVSGALALVGESPCPGEFFQTICDAVARETAARVVIEKTPGHALFVQRILESLPDCSFIVVSREPLGFVASLTHRSDRRGILALPALRRLAYHPAITVVMWRRYARAIIAARRSNDARFLFVDHDEIESDPGGVVWRALRHVGVTPETPEVDVRPVNSSFSGKSRRGPPLATNYWLNLLAKREVRTLYSNMSLSGPSTSNVVCSWLSLAPSLLAFGFYAPNSTKRYAYALNIFGGRQ